jgi:hypothetical protein
MNKENAHLYLPLVQALAEGKTIQYGSGSIWGEVKDPNFINPPQYYRVKPEPVMVPLELEDVPPGSALRAIGNSKWFLVSRASKFGVYFGSLLSEYTELQGSWQIKRPGEDWMPCHKPA